MGSTGKEERDTFFKTIAFSTMSILYMSFSGILFIKYNNFKEGNGYISKARERILKEERVRNDFRKFQESSCDISLENSRITLL